VVLKARTAGAGEPGLIGLLCRDLG
jgi:hypothetical protein